MGTETNHSKDDRNTPEYLAQLLKDKKQMQAFPNVFLHAERLIDEGKSALQDAHTWRVPNGLKHGIYAFRM